MRYLTGKMVFLVVFGLTSCQNGQDKKEEVALQDTLQVVEFEEPVIPSSEFIQFANGFSTRLTNINYNEEWLEEFTQESKIREISPKVCEEFIYGKQVWNHGLENIADCYNKKKISEDKPYYYVGQIAESGNYTILIFSDLEEQATETYLCTYGKDGAFKSGIVLQATYKKEGQTLVRNTEIKPSSLLIIEEKSPKNSRILNFKITSEGEIISTEQAS
ncbi:MAG: hypothetical protein ACI85I_001420 [Arenicella sp.]|jgi:hypothetical protein